VTTVLSHHYCACGYAASDPGELTDHLLEAFTSADDRGTDGLVHDETSPALTCACGYTAATPDDLDAHFLDVFVPADGLGADSQRHAA